MSKMWDIKNCLLNLKVTAKLIAGSVLANKSIQNIFEII